MTLEAARDKKLVVKMQTLRVITCSGIPQSSKRGGHELPQKAARNQNLGGHFAKCAPMTPCSTPGQPQHGSLFCCRVFSLNFWWGGLKVFGPRQSPTGTKWDGGDLRKKSDWSQNCPPNAKIRPFFATLSTNTFELKSSQIRHKNVFKFFKFSGTNLGGGEQALVQKRGQVSDGGRLTKFLPDGGPPVPPGKKPLCCGINLTSEGSSSDPNSGSDGGLSSCSSRGNRPPPAPAMLFYQFSVLMVKSEMKCNKVSINIRKLVGEIEQNKRKTPHTHLI